LDDNVADFNADTKQYTVDHRKPEPDPFAICVSFDNPKFHSVPEPDPDSDAVAVVVPSRLAHAYWHWDPEPFRHIVIITDGHAHEYAKRHADINEVRHADFDADSHTNWHAVGMVHQRLLILVLGCAPRRERCKRHARHNADSDR